MNTLSGFGSDCDDALAFSRAYLRHYWVLGLVPVILTTIMTGWVPVLVLGVVALGISSVWIFPGAALIHFAGVRWFPSRAWDSDFPRAFVAGLLSLPLVWGSLFMMVKFQIDPPALLINAIGHDMAWLAHAIGTMMVGSSLSVAGAWALSPQSTSSALR